MTGEPTHTASKERMVPELMFLKCFRLNVRPAIKNCFKSAVAITLRFQLCSARYTVLQTKKTTEEVPLQQSSHLKNTTIRVPPTIITASKVQQSLRFTFNYVTQRYKRRTVLESSLQSVQSPRKIQTIPIYKHTVGKPCIMLLRIDTLSCQQIEMGTQRKTKVSP